MTNQRKGERRERPEPEAALAIGSFVCFAGALFAVMWGKLPPDNEKYVMLMLGALIGLVKDTFARYFSSTKGAQEQRRETAKVAETLAAAVPVVATAPQPVVITNSPEAPVPVEEAKPAPGSTEVMP